MVFQYKIDFHYLLNIINYSGSKDYFYMWIGQNNGGVGWCVFNKIAHGYLFCNKAFYTSKYKKYN